MSEPDASASVPELSKGEAKKLAKKMEKAAKKQQGTSAANSSAAPTAAPPVTNNESKNATPAAATPSQTATTLPSSNSKPQLKLLVPLSLSSSSTEPFDASSSDALTLLKVVWASQHYQTSPDLFTIVDSPAVERVQLQFSDPYGQTLVLLQPNAMVRALVDAGAVDPSSHHAGGIHNDLLQDDWCQWEQDCLRPSLSDPAKLAAALEHLAQSLKTHSHLGDDFGCADLCLLATLSTLSTVDPPLLPPAVAHYVSSHHAALDKARNAVQKIVGDKTLLQQLQAVFALAVAKLYPSALNSLPTYYVSKTNHKTSDYQCSLPMALAAFLKNNNSSLSSLPPLTAQQVAQTLLEAVQDHPLVAHPLVFGPGFICFQVSASHLETSVNQLLQSQKLPMPQLSNQVCLVDFSSPNVAKEMHVGHLRSTIIGESVCRILEACGCAKVHRVNHIGDWGTQFGMLIQYLQEETMSATQAAATSTTGDAAPAEPNITDLTVFYKSAKERFDQDPDFKVASQRNVVKLQSGDPECRRIWQKLCDISRREFEKVYRRLDVTLTECGESFYNGRIPAVLQDFEKAKLLELDQGARVVRIPGQPVPLMLQKSDGGFGYDSTDMAALKYRLHELNTDRVIIITDFSQETHFHMVYEAGRMIGYVDRNQRLEHIGFGTVMGEDGKRFKTRSGDTVRLVDLLDEAVSRMEAQLKERISQGKANITLDEVHTVAEAIGYGALKYFDLRRNPKSNYKFSYDEMLDTKGDTAVYLLYARVRLESILAKAQKDYQVDVDGLLRDALDPSSSLKGIVLEHEAERALALSLCTFPDVMVQTLDDLFPSHICEYVYRVANSATDFVTKCKVLGSPEMTSRLLLCQVTAMAIHQCFDLLGIRHVKRI